MKKSFIVVGLGRFGLGVVKTLASLKADVLAIDLYDEPVNKASEFVNNCAVCDSTKKSALKELGVSDIDHAVVAIGGNFQATILTVINLSELGVKNITVRIDDVEYETLMKRLGATDVIIPEEASAIGLAHQIISESITDYYNLDKEYGVVKIEVDEKFVPIELGVMDPRNKFEVNIVAIDRNGKYMIPKGVDMVLPGDILIVVGKSSKLSRFDRYINEN